MRGEKPIRRFTAGMVITAMLTGTLGAANAQPAYGNPGGIYKGITVSGVTTGNVMDKILPGYRFAGGGSCNKA